MALYQDEVTRNVRVRNRPRIGEWLMVCASIGLSVYTMSGQYHMLAAQVGSVAQIFGL